MPPNTPRELFAEAQALFDGTQLGPETWYLVVLATLTGGPNPNYAQDLYLYLTEQHAYATSATRQKLIRRLREVLVKSTAVVGVCKPLEAVMAINKVEKEEDKDHTSTREGWHCDDNNLTRGEGFLQKLYQGNIEELLALFQDHQDFIWITKRISYGLYLSDRQVLDDVETELVVLPGIMIQNLSTEAVWHLYHEMQASTCWGEVDVEFS